MADEEEGMSFLDHLEELRQVILRCLGVLALAMVPAALFAREILHFISQPLVTLGVDPATFLQVPQVMGSFKVLVSLVFWGGLFLALPVMIYLISGFIFPGLHPHEQRVVRRCGFASVVLFFVGASMGYYGTVTQALKALLFSIPAWMGTAPEWIYLTDYVMFVLKLVIGFGLSFELPLVLLGLGYAGLIETRQLTGKRRHVLVGLLFVAMMLTPPEPVSQLIMAGSLYVLYEGCILLLKRHERRTELSETA